MGPDVPFSVFQRPLESRVVTKRCSFENDDLISFLVILAILPEFEETQSQTKNWHCLAQK